jgi:HSP90 family molecular chaperone
LCPSIRERISAQSGFSWGAAMSKIRVNVPAIVRLIGSRLYPNEEVVLRELIQNSYDAIKTRFDKKADQLGRIDVRVSTSRPSLTVVDNGIGMDRDDLDIYLSTLGEINDAQKGTKSDDSDIIGEMGIGFFSAYMLSNEISVTTRKEGSQSTYVWKSMGVEDYDIQGISADDEPIGTNVSIDLSQGSHHLANIERISKIVRRHCSYLDCPIFVNASDQPINDRHFPWELKSRQNQSDSIRRRLAKSVKYHHVGEKTIGRIRFSFAFAYVDCTSSNKLDSLMLQVKTHFACSQSPFDTPFAAAESSPF